MSDPNVIAPASKPQAMFLSTPDWVDICFYGGQAGGGKTWAGLAHHAKYMHDPLYRGLTLRRTTPMLLKPGAVWDEAKQLYRLLDPDCRIRIKDLKIIASSDAEVFFSHFERVDDTDNFQGAQISSCVMEELCQFEESQFNYILSRLRTKANMKPNMRATMNPDPDSWVRKWVDWYLYPEGHELFGRPDPAKQGVIRWFVRLDNEMFWADTKEELAERFPDAVPLSFRFIAASVYDNPHIEKSYIAFLQGLPRIQKEILLYGNWEARPESNSLIRREWFVECAEEPAWTDIVKTVRTYDFAGTLKGPDTVYDPDYTASIKISKLKNGEYFIHDVIRTRIRFGEWSRFVLENALRDGVKVDIVIPEDPGPSAKAATMMLAREISEQGYFVRTLKTNQKKIDRFRPFASFTMNGGMKILKNCGNDFENKVYNDLSFFYKELETFTGERKSGSQGHDDLVDVCSDGFIVLAQKLSIPLFTLPSVTKSNEFSF
jgi:predicted phage terminase large subunit-like protein